MANNKSGTTDGMKTANILRVGMSTLLLMLLDKNCISYFIYDIASEDCAKRTSVVVSAKMTIKVNDFVM